MGSPLGPVITNLFMVELESVLVPKLNDHAKKWGRFVDGTFFTSSVVQLNMFCQYWIRFKIKVYLWTSE